MQIASAPGQPFALPGGSLDAQAPDDPRSSAFADLLTRLTKEPTDGSAAPKPDNGPEDTRETALKEAARQMEIQMVTLMFKEMEKASSEEGLLGGGKSAGMSHFKDMFLYQVAEQVVSQRGLGFSQSLLTNYKNK